MELREILIRVAKSRGVGEKKLGSLSAQKELSLRIDLIFLLHGTFEFEGKTNFNGIWNPVRLSSGRCKQEFISLIHFK